MYNLVQTFTHPTQQMQGVQCEAGNISVAGLNPNKLDNLSLKIR